MSDSVDSDRYYGKYRGKVVDNKDVDGLGKLQVEVPDVLGEVHLNNQQTIVKLTAEDIQLSSGESSQATIAAGQVELKNGENTVTVAAESISLKQSPAEITLSATGVALKNGFPSINLSAASVSINEGALEVT